MLPRAARLHASEDFRRTIRRGRRVARPTLVLHVGTSARQTSARVGLVVSKAVGNAVVRNRVKRRLRHLAVPHLAAAPAGLDVVVRALPRAAQQPGELAPDLASAWTAALRRHHPGGGPTAT